MAGSGDDTGAVALDARDEAAAGEVPRPLIWALRLVGALVVLAGLVVVAMVVWQDVLLRTWAEGNPSALRILQTEGLQALKDAPPGRIEQPHFIAPAITLYVTVVLMLWVLSVFAYNGFEWGRLSITVLLVVVAIASVGGLLTEPPFFVVAGVVAGIVVGLAALACLWLPATTRYIHPRRGEPARGGRSDRP